MSKDDLKNTYDRLAQEPDIAKELAAMKREEELYACLFQDEKSLAYHFNLPEDPVNTHFSTSEIESAECSLDGEFRRFLLDEKVDLLGKEKTIRELEDASEGVYERGELIELIIDSFRYKLAYISKVKHFVIDDTTFHGANCKKNP